MRCKHQNARVVNLEETSRGHRINAFCDACQQGWFGATYEWYSQRGKLHRPPQWVTRLFTATLARAALEGGGK